LQAKAQGEANVAMLRAKVALLPVLVLICSLQLRIKNSKKKRLLVNLGQKIICKSNQMKK